MGVEMIEIRQVWNAPEDTRGCISCMCTHSVHIISREAIGLTLPCIIGEGRAPWRLRMQG